jgi:MarR family 2-MHQ and catechol resistance regulon transcriptional repressor
MPKRYPGMTADARAFASYVKLLRAGEGVLREAARPLALYDLTPSQFGVLEALYQGGPQCLSELARRILKSSGNLTLVVANLQKRRLVRRSAGGRDRRFTTIALTAKGRNLVQSISPGYAAAIASVMGRLTPREQETLGELCGKLGHAAEAPKR